jgi:hypothetical protein
MTAIREELPDDATIQQVAEVFGVSDKVDQLTPKAQSLTKGQLVALLGADDAKAAAWQVVTPARPTTKAIERNSGHHKLGLSVQDIKSIEDVFGGDAFPAEERVAMLNSLTVELNKPDALRTGEITNNALAMAMPDSITLYVCCCPCCCATAVTAPVSQATA